MPPRVCVKKRREEQLQSRLPCWRQPGCSMVVFAKPWSEMIVRVMRQLAEETSCQTHAAVCKKGGPHVTPVHQMLFLLLPVDGGPPRPVTAPGLPPAGG
jgi:hypothetical protein